MFFFYNIFYRKFSIIALFKETKDSVQILIKYLFNFIHWTNAIKNNKPQLKNKYFYESRIFSFLNRISSTNNQNFFLRPFANDKIYYLFTNGIFLHLKFIIEIYYIWYDAMHIKILQMHYFLPFDSPLIWNGFDVGKKCEYIPMSEYIGVQQQKNNIISQPDWKSISS